MRIGCMMVVVIVVIMVIMMMVVIVVIMVMVMVVVMLVLCLQSTHASTEGIAERTISHIRSRCIRPLAFDMVVVAFLHCTDFVFKAQHLSAVFAQNTSRWRNSAKCRMTAVFDTDLVGFAVFQCQHLAAIAADAAVGWRFFAVLL